MQETTFKAKDLDNTGSDDNFCLDKEISTEENFKEPALATGIHERRIKRRKYMSGRPRERLPHSRPMAWNSDIP